MKRTITLALVLALSATTSAQAAPKVGTIGPHNVMCSVLSEARKYSDIAATVDREGFRQVMYKSNFDWSCLLTDGYQRGELIKSNGDMACIRLEGVGPHCYWTKAFLFGRDN